MHRVHRSKGQRHVGLPSAIARRYKDPVGAHPLRILWILQLQIPAQKKSFQFMTSLYKLKHFSDALEDGSPMASKDT